MRKTGQVRTFNFEIELNGRTYRCRREVVGTRTFRQTIFVEGLGSEEDSPTYGGPHGSPVETMEGMARMIAREIIGDK